MKSSLRKNGQEILTMKELQYGSISTETENLISMKSIYFTSKYNNPVSGKFNVPADAFVSMTDYKYVVMRVAMERDGIPVNCTILRMEK
jgi:hypothetical protein